MRFTVIRYRRCMCVSAVLVLSNRPPMFNADCGLDPGALLIAIPEQPSSTEEQFLTGHARPELQS